MPGDSRRMLNDRGAAAPAALAFGVGLLLIAARSADAANLSTLDPAGPTAESIRELLTLVTAIAAVIFLVVTGTLVYCVIRFRHRSGGPDAEPPQIYGSTPIETAWTVGPILIVFVLTLVIIRSVVEARQADPQPGAMTVRVIGHQWWWEFRYPDHGVVAANEMHIPVSSPNQRRPIHLRLESADVVHSFWVPRLAGKTDLIPGRPNDMWFEAAQPGVFHGQCAEFCGMQHANMMIRVVVEPPQEFEQWLARQKQNAVESSAAAAGRALFFAKTCANCHTIRGTGASGTVGPDLTHLASRQTIAAAELPNDRRNLVAWLTNPAALKPGCRMPDLKLPPADVDALVTYLETLR
jgi:cytochrome c oxidase subunit 2